MAPADLKPFIMKPEAGLPADAPVHQTGFAAGRKDIAPDHKECLAKVTHNGATGESQYFVRTRTFGFRANEMFNPQVHPTEELDAVQQASGRQYFEFRPVTVDSFTQYLRFLKTGNPASLRSAERGS